MKTNEKLRVLIPHWIEHNQVHADEFESWAEKAGDVAEDIHAAARAIRNANHALEHALETLGGPLEGEHGHTDHHHHHHDDHG